jgi:hypothetical protein
MAATRLDPRAAFLGIVRQALRYRLASGQDRHLTIAHTHVNYAVILLDTALRLGLRAGVPPGRLRVVEGLLDEAQAAQDRLQRVLLRRLGEKGPSLPGTGW